VGRLTGIDTVLLLDLDGTLYVGSQVVPGAPETVRWLRAQGLTVRFTTNTDSISPTALADRLAGPGERATHVLVADPGHGATYDDLDAAFRALRSEAQLVTTQVNRIARRDDGEHLDTGGWVRLLEYATGQTARVLGKPSPEFLTAPPERARPRGTERAGGRRRPGRRHRWPHGRRGDGAGPQRQGRPPPARRRGRAGRSGRRVADLPGLLQA
jgi:ribonucleotide monophosphatase NagD (HAD superfamily)